MENLENGEDIYDEETTTQENKLDEDYEENEKEVIAPKKKKTFTKDSIKTTTSAQEVKKVTESEKATTLDTTNSTTFNNSEEVIVPRLNVDGTQIAFMPNVTSDNETTVETTTERELEINDIANMIFPGRGNKTNEEQDDNIGEHDSFFDDSGEKGNSSANGNFKLSLIVFLICLTCLSL